MLEAIQTSGYRPNSIGRALASGRTNTVGLWVPIVNRSVSGHFINHIGRLARADGYHVVVVEIVGETPETLSLAGLIDAGTVDGILAVDATSLVEGLLARYKNLPPIVTMGPAFSLLTDHAGVDLASGSKQAMAHLVKTGRRKIAFLADHNHQYPGDSRYDAYAAGIAETQGTLDILPLAVARMADAYRAVKDRFSKTDPPDALFCFNDECAIGANKALSDLNISVPHDVAIIGSDGIDETEYAIPGISTVAQPFEETSQLAWQYLLRRIEQPGAPLVGEILQMHLIKRQSTGSEKTQ